MDELNEIKNDLLSVEMSTVIDDYSYYNMKASKRRTNSFRTAYSKEENNAIFVGAVNQFLWNEINNDLISSNRFEYDSLPKKVQMNCNTYIRDKSKSDDIKTLYKYCCQICGKPLDIGNSLYSEVHHLHPLYLGGPDTQDNMINLCPNHHTLFDRGAITIDIENMKVFHVNKTIEDLILLKHSISKESILYHNQNIFNKKQTFSFDLNEKESIINYGCKVLLINILTKEEKVIFIESNEFDINFSTYLLLNYRRGDHVLYNGVTYIIQKID